MSAEFFERAKAIFTDAMQYTLDERRAFVHRACTGDLELEAEVLSLLEHDHESGEWLSPALAAPDALTLTAPGPKIGQRVGDFTLQSLIATGGMGSVYLAIQGKPRRKVALKVMRYGLSSPSAMRRFEFESQTLARLRHPNIAQVHEAGTHDVDGVGVPYFAMEYVVGAKPITAFAEARELGLRERLALFAQVCDAVHHGHQKGIIHRDLKPSNILIDSSGVPKIIDFGVARATDSDLAATLQQTDVGQLVGTLQYMSPEQCAADPDDLDMRSDVYALGVVLYELLCHRLPYDLANAAVVEAVRVIQHDKPEHPSAIDRTLRGDVETITLKALEKDRTRRYSSAADLGADIGRYLRDEPITARPPSLVYQLHTFARRHRSVFAMGTVGVLAVVVGLVVAIVALAHANAERARADENFRTGSQLAEAVIGVFHDRIAELPGSLEARLTIADATLAYLDGLGPDERGDPVASRQRAWAHHRVGQILGSLGGSGLNEPEAARRHLEEARRIRERLLGEFPEDHENRLGLAMVVYDLANTAEDDEVRLTRLREASAIAAALPAEDGRRPMALCELKIGDLVKRQGGDPSAHFAAARDFAERQLNADPDDERAQRDLGVILSRVGQAQLAAEDLDAAAATYDELIRIRRRALEAFPSSPRRNRDLMLAREYMVRLLAVQPGHEDEVIAIHREVMHTAELLAQLEPALLRPRKDLARTYWAGGKALCEAGLRREGLERLDRAIALYEAILDDGPQARDVATSRARLADCRAARVAFGETE